MGTQKKGGKKNFFFISRDGCERYLESKKFLNRVLRNSTLRFIGLSIQLLLTAFNYFCFFFILLTRIIGQVKTCKKTTT